MSTNEERAKEFAEGIYAAIHGAAEEGVSVTEKHRTVILDAWTEEVCALLDERDEPPQDGPLAKGNQELARGLARQVLGDIMVAATEGDEAARDVIDFKDEILDRWENAIRELLDKKDEQLTPDPLGLAARVVVLEEALKEIALGGTKIPSCSWCKLDTSGGREHAVDCPVGLALATPSPAAEALREALAWTLKEEYALDAAAEPGYTGGAQAWEGEAQRCRDAKILAVDHLRTHFPALAAGLEVGR